MWISWIPNALSIGNLVIGFISILFASTLNLETAEESRILSVSGLLILAAVLLDGFDGITARYLNVESALGEYLDTLADMTTFGIAPGFIFYLIYLQDKNIDFISLHLPLGMLTASIYPACAAYRLARFSKGHDVKFFVGLPSPIAASLIILSTVFISFKLPFWLVLSIYFFLSILMVSNIKYAKPHSFLRTHFNILRLILFLLLFLSLILSFGWYWVALSILSLYVFSGLLSMLLHTIQKLRLHLSK